MRLTSTESPVALEKLDGHLKALLRLKIREFVHLSPWFKDVPEADSTALQGLVRGGSAGFRLQKAPACPNREHHANIGRRHVRSAAHLRSL